jgi:hypothetical protein
MGPIKAALLALYVVVLIGLAIFLGGCSTTKAPPSTSWCDLNKPFRPTEQSFAAMDDDEVAEALSHNKYGQKACGWRA